MFMNMSVGMSMSVGMGMKHCILGYPCQNIFTFLRKFFDKFLSFRPYLFNDSDLVFWSP